MIAHILIITESEWDCKHSKKPYLPPDMKNKTWGYFGNELELKSIFCDECKMFCDADINCEGIVCFPKESETKNCIWVKKKIGQSCDIENSNMYSTCWKNKSGD